MNQPFPNFKTLTSEARQSRHRLDKLFALAEKEQQRIQEKYKPRNQFNRWKQSIDGQQWKRDKFLKQREKCAICGDPISLLGSHIDHIKPMSQFPELALKTDNLQITCPACNQKKGQTVPSNG
jgi:5-methylcytosine-specific restriction endonuclease McrA